MDENVEYNELASERSLRIKEEIYDWLGCVVSALLFCVLMFVFFVRIIGVEGYSMQPTLHDDDKVVVSNLFYTPTPGDIVVFRKASFRYEPLVKRIIATEGQTVDINAETGEVIIDGKVLEEEYIADLTGARTAFYGPQTVPPGQLFVMGDNRNNSTDSRSNSVGFVDARYIMGKVYCILLPPSNFRALY